MKHTPGPWILEDNKILHTVVVAGDVVRIPVAELRVPGLYSTTETMREYTANGRLLVNAPDLLEALKEVVRISDRKHDAWDAARAAIARAEGRE